MAPVALAAASFVASLVFSHALSVSQCVPGLPTPPLRLTADPRSVEGITHLILDEA